MPALSAIMKSNTACLGVLFTFATSQLVWPHYHLFALIPIFWLVRTDGKLDMATLGAADTCCFPLRCETAASHPGVKFGPT